MGFFDRLTGANIEKNLAQYSEVYGEILLGMHRDLERHRALIQEHDERMREGLARFGLIQDQMGQAVTKAETHSENASRFCEAAKSAAVFADGTAKQSKEELDKAKGFLM